MISGETLELVESRWRNLPVLVVGDVMLDQYVWGEVERISPEAPVPVVRAAVRDERPGGAANVALNLANLGACVSLVGFAGGDNEHAHLERLLTEAGIEPWLTPTPQIPTTTKLRILSGHQKMMRLDTESRTAYSSGDYESLLENAMTLLPQAAVVVLSDYAKGALKEEVCQSMIRAAVERGIPVLVDPKQRNFVRYRGATAICPNLKELATATGESVAGVDRVLHAAQALISELGLQYIIATLGEKGITVLSPSGRLHAPAVVRQVYDVTGAGDTVVAVLALAMACNMGMEAAIELANIAAGVVVSKVGTVPIRQEELLAELSPQIALGIDEKVLPLERLLGCAASWRSRGQRLVFTNGCFDILHIGHIRLLEKARRKGDRLIVGLNSDESVRRLKGASRPVVGEAERGQVLAALSSVDAVVIFQEDTPLRLIEALRPDVLVKGGDYTEDNVVGAPQVRSWGGRVELIPLVPGVSSTHLMVKSAARVTPELAARAVRA